MRTRLSGVGEEGLELRMSRNVSAARDRSFGDGGLSFLSARAGAAQIALNG
jgi:hypothetical protein